MKEFVEKLIGMLEESTIYDKQAIGFMNKYGRNIGFISKNKAIEIVNQLAEEYNNDVCEWKYHRTIDDIPMYETSCYHEFEKRFVKKYKFCPYCGKKIKVVE